MTGPSTVPYLLIFTVTCELTDSRQLVNGPQRAPFWRLMTRWHGGFYSLIGVSFPPQSTGSG